MSTEQEPVVLKKTALYEEHVKAAAKVVDFGGWLMPVQYTGIIDEHNAVRNALGLFDISHMGEVYVSGPEAKAWLNSLLTNNIERIAPGEGQYTFLLNAEGGVIDDLLVYQTGAQEYLLVVNASMIDEDVAWLQSHLHEGHDGVKLVDRSGEAAGLAIQGPNTVAFFEALTGAAASTLPARNEIAPITIDGVEMLISRTGYTGEDGFELFLPATAAAQLWQKILEVGAAFGIKPCGLGARDTLRLEMCYPLNGNDLSPTKTPLEAGLGFFVDLGKADFMGRSVLQQQKEEGVKQRLVAFKMRDKCPPPRAHYPVVKGGEVIGETSSGSLSPSLGAGIGMAYLPVAAAKVGEEIEIDIRGRRFVGIIEKKPLYRPAAAQK